MEARLGDPEYFSYLSTISDEALERDIAEWQDAELTAFMLTATKLSHLKTLRSVFSVMVKQTEIARVLSKLGF